MASTKKTRSFYLHNHALELLDRYDKKDEWSVSSAVSSFLIRYFSILELECPALNKNEWLAICDVANGMFKHTDSRINDPARHLWAIVESAVELEGLSEKWEIDGMALAKTLRELSYVQQCAVIEVATLFWHAPAQDYDEMLAFAKAKMPK